jgi:hypothetical protein
MKNLPSIALFSNLLYLPLSMRAFFFSMFAFCWATTAIAGPCQPPQKPRITTVLSTKMTVSWEDNDNNYPVRVSYAEYPGNSFIFKETQGLSIELTGLKPATQYIVRINSICGDRGGTSTTLSMGVIRTLSTAEETKLCSNQTQQTLCDALQAIKTGDRGENYIDIVIPNFNLPIYNGEMGTIVFGYQYADNTNQDDYIWIGDKLRPMLGQVFRLNNLKANALYRILVRTDINKEICEIKLNDTPTYGPDFIGPVFTQVPPNLTLDCSAPKPYNIDYPIISGGCSTPRITFTDEEGGDGCSRTLTRTWTAVDDCGRQSTVLQIISFQDTEPPRFLDLPLHNAIVECGHTIPGEEKPEVVDNCGDVELSMTEVHEGPDECNLTIKRTWIATDNCGNSATYIEVIEVHQNVDESTGNDPDVPPLPVACGVAFTPPAITNIVQLPNFDNQPWDISGFPVLIKEHQRLSNGTYSGKAKVRLPFGNKVVYVNFEGVGVNTDRKIFAGSLEGIASGDFVVPSGEINIGGDICIPEPPVATFGFNINGEYIQQPPYDGWVQGAPIDIHYDPNGFDANGINIATGTAFNSQGCSQAGVNPEGNPCDPGTQGPYHWLQNNNSNAPTTAAGLAFANSPAVLTTIRDKVKAVLLEMQAENEALINTQRTTCGVARTELTTVASGLNNAYLFGQNNEYLAEDMNLRFPTAPISLQVHVPERTAQVVSIEEKHIALYYCDKLLFRKKKSVTILGEYLSPTGLDLCVADILEAIKRLPEAEITGFTTNDALFLAWIKTFLTTRLTNELINRGFVYNAPAKEKIYDYSPPQQGKTREFPQYGNTANLALAGDEANELLKLAVAQSFEETEADLKFQFDQGWEYIGNTHRAFYLDAIAKARDYRTTATLDDADPDPESLLPIRIEKEVAGRTYTILLDAIRFGVNGGSLDAYFILDIPSTGGRVVFRATGVPFTPAGLAAANTQLKLLSDVNIRLNNAAKLKIKGTADQTYVNWDCNGFAGMSIDAEVEFCRNYLTPIDPSSLAVITDETQRVTARFTTLMPSWGEFVTTLKMTPFALTKHLDYKWEVIDATIDFSETANAPMTISPNYFTEFMQGTQVRPQWKGFYLSKLKVTLPKRFNKDSPTPVTVSASNLFIDDKGLTGVIGVQAQIISLAQGNLSGWAYSMDEISIAVVNNRIQGGAFSGLLNVPIFASSGSQGGAVTPQDCFRYTAKIISTAVGEYYEFAVKPNGALQVDIWKANATLEPNSFLKISYQNDNFSILANLTGKMEIAGDVADGTHMDLPSLNFQNIIIANEAPYFRGGTFGLGGNVGVNFGGFGLTIDLPEIVKNTDNSPYTTFRVGAGLSLVTDSDNGLDISAKTIIDLQGEMITVNNRQRWKYKKMGDVYVKIAASWRGVEKVKGELYWFNKNDTYGTGFQGKVAVHFDGLKMGYLGIEAMALFGKVDNYKYFFIDALANFSPGIPISAVSIMGFGGGAYYHMDRDATSFAGMANAPTHVTLPDILGVSLSGIKYKPVPDPILGLKASVLLALTGNEEVFNAGATFEVVFFGASIQRISLEGTAHLMMPIDLGNNALFGAPNTATSSFAAKMAISYVFPTKTLDGTLEVFANVQNVFVGAGDNDLVGKAEIHFEPGDKWYINVGTPSHRLGYKVVIAGMDLLTVESYLCIGTKIPTMPALPSYVSDIVGGGDFVASESRRATGRGFAFGANFKVTTGELQWTIFYASLTAGAGFDVMLQKYNINCTNNNNRPIGVNGWYASGQAYAFIDAGVGLKVGNDRYEILTLAVAASLQVKLPNPFWARGAVGGSYSVLGGLYAGDCHFKFTLGESCESNATENDDIAYFKLIENIAPSDKADHVEVNSKPKASFGMPVGVAFPMANDDGDEQIFHTTLMEAKMFKTSDNTPIPFEFDYSADKYQLNFKTRGFLAGYTEYTVTAKVQCKKGNELMREETKTITFKTGSAPSTIPPSNVKYSYPLDGMHNVYRNERNKGYIKLKEGQEYLLSENPLVVRFTAKNGSVTNVTPTVSEYGSLISFDFPSAAMVKNKVYLMELIALETGITIGGNTGGSNRPHGPNAPWDNEEDEIKEVVLYKLYFRTSLYDQFQAKMTAIAAGNNAATNNRVMNRPITIEPFDKIELEGTDQVLPLIRTDISSIYVDWAKAAYLEMKYFGYDIEVDMLRDANLFPIKYFSQNIILPRITIADYNSNLTYSPVSVVFSNLSASIIIRDNQDFRNNSIMKVMNECASNTNTSSQTSPDPMTCNSTYRTNIFNNYPKLKEIYLHNPSSNEPIQPVLNSTQPIGLRYMMPDGTTLSTGSMNVNFKY